jgi:hypothetical protein
MGRFNGGQLQVPKILEDKKCPFCKSNFIIEKNVPRLIESDSYEYQCNTCNPNSIISLSGGLVVCLSELMEGNERNLMQVKNYIYNSTDEIIHITEKYLR